MKYACIKTPIGTLKLFLDEKLRLIKIIKVSDLNYEQLNKTHDFCNELIESFNAYFSGKSLTIDYPVNLESLTVFERGVLNFISKIPYAQKVSYKWVAENLKTSPRAVGQALRRNPLPILIPCHRVIKVSGELGGYSLGLKAKKWLIEHERAILYRLQLHKI